MRHTKRSTPRRPRRAAHIRSHAVGLLLVLALAAGLSATAGASTTAKKADNWKFAIVTDLSGPLNLYGASELAGLKTWFAYTNSKGGVLGRKVDLSIHDDRSDISAGLAEFKAALDEKPLALLGPFVSTLTAAAGPLAATADQTTVFWSPVAALMVPPQPALFGGTLTLAMSARIQASVIAGLARTVGQSKPKIVIARADSAAGQDFSKSAHDVIDQRGWTLLGEEKFANTATDVSDQAARMAKTGADYCLCGTFGNPNLQLVRALRNNGSKMAVVTYYGGGFASTFGALNDPNYYAVLPYLDPATPGIPGADTMRKRARNSGQQKYLVGYSFTQGYVEGMIMTQALAQCGAGCSRDSFRKTLVAKTTKYTTDGLTGPITLSNGNQFLVDSGKAFHVVDGKITPIPGWRSSRY